MKNTLHWHAGALLILLLFATVGRAGERSDRDPQMDVYDLYARLSPGMSIQTVRSLAAHSGRSELGEFVTAWLLWRHEAPGRGTEVLRASFRDGRLVRVEYESFAHEYRHFVKGDSTVPMDASEIRQLWRRMTRADQAVGSCHEALDAFHRLVMRAQERLTTNEQEEWIRALQLRRAAEAEAP